MKMKRINFYHLLQMVISKVENIDCKTFLLEKEGKDYITLSMDNQKFDFATLYKEDVTFDEIKTIIRAYCIEYDYLVKMYKLLEQNIVLNDEIIEMEVYQMDDIAETIAIYKMYDNDNFNEARDYEGYTRFLN